MEPAPRHRFLRTVAFSSALAIVLAAVASPPDPVTQLVYSVPLLLLAVIVSYLLTYKGGFEYLESRR